MQITDSRWDELKPSLNQTLIDILTTKMGFDRMMPVQKTVVPLFIQNYDVAVESCTGSGKTLAFLVPMVHKFLESRKSKTGKSGVYGMVISPTRELAMQIHAILVDIINYVADKSINITSLLLIGGSKTLIDTVDSDVDIIVATPGRLRELLYEHTTIEINMKNLEFLILDEADRLIDNDHKIDVKQIIAKLPKQRRTGLFSATLTGVSMTELIKYGLRNPVKVKLKTESKSESNHSVPERLENFYKALDNRVDKIGYLISLLDKYKAEKIMVFFNTCDSVEFYYKILKHLFPVKFMKTYGRMKQQQRSKVFKDFNETSTGVLMTTDVMARGADFPNVGYIIQVDPPQNPEFFIHRIGRTARGEASGKAIILVSKPEISFIDYLNDRQIKMMPFKGGDDYLSKKEETYKKLKSIMIQDKALFEKAKRAFVSFTRSYKEHQLKDVFKFDQLDLKASAESFLLPFVPMMKETKLLKGKLMIDADYYNQYKEAEFKDKNQQKQFESNKDKLLEKRDKMKKEQKKIKHKVQKEGDKKKLRTFQERKRAKDREVVNDFVEFSYEEKLAKRLKKGQITREKFNELVEKIDRKYEDSD